MIKLIIFYILDQIMCLNEEFSGCRYIGRQDESGKVLYGDYEKKFVGITDTKGNYFYIRQLHDKDDYEILDDRVRYLVTGHYRLVAIFEKFDVNMIYDKMVDDLMAIEPFKFSIRAKPYIRVKGGDTAIDVIYKEETGTELKKWNRDFRLVSIDFDIMYYRGGYQCYNEELCVNLDFQAFQVLKQDNPTMEKILAKIELT